MTPDGTLMTLAQAQAWLPGCRLVGEPSIAITRVHSDTRTLRRGDLFVALKGDRFDAHEFLPQAREAGAAAALASHGLEAAGLSGLEVPDTLQALQSLASAWRRHCSLPLIAVTGSNGKTTVTQMTASILQAWYGGQALATAGNFNNHIGVPLTLLRLKPRGPQVHRVAVLELGMNHPGEIAQLAAMAQPTVALVNNAQREHQEFMHSVEAVARENGRVIESLPPDGVVVVPARDAQASVWREMAGARRIIDFEVLDEGGTSAAAVQARAQWFSHGAFWQIALATPAGHMSLRLSMPGLHNVHNAAAACAASMAAGAPLEKVVQGLCAFEPVAGRSQLKGGHLRGRPLQLIDDSYNANPDSVKAAIDLLSTLPPPRTLILGDMGEVGNSGPEYHDEVGRHAHAQGIDHLWTAGSLMRHAHKAFSEALGPLKAVSCSRHFDDVEALIRSCVDLPDCATVLVKGSRFMRMERVVACLQEGC